MNLSQSEISKIADTLLTFDDGSTIGFDERDFSKAESDAIITELLERLGTTQHSREDAVNTCNDILEKLADHAMPLACKFMDSLYPRAGELFMHDVCDSIKIWKWELEKKKTS